MDFVPIDSCDKLQNCQVPISIIEFLQANREGQAGRKPVPPERQ